jgi:hypothetical protein
MNIKMYQSLATVIGAEFLKDYGVDFDRFRWESRKFVEIDLAKFSMFKVLQLKNQIAEFPAHKGAQAALKDITIWMDANKDVEGTKATNVKQFFAMLQKYMLKHVPGQRVFHHDKGRDAWFCYYVHKISYTPPRSTSWGVQPHYVTVYFTHREFGKNHYGQFHLHDADVRGHTVPQVFAEQEYIPETADLRAIYLDQMDKYEAWHAAFGKQFWATGDADDNGIDGNPGHDHHERHWYWRKINSFRLDKDGEPGRVLIDVFQEDDQNTEDSRDQDKVDPLFWIKIQKEQPDEDGDISSVDDEEVLSDDKVTLEPLHIPIHPLVCVFSLKKHMRLRAHVTQLTEYQYDRDMGNRLVLPDEDRALIEIFLAHKSTFADVVAGKGGGSVVLCTGGPGLGKTLTAEIYSEVSAKPLYTVQCSQLGTEPDEIEGNLLKCMARAERWGAILLLDEADVYIRTRGDDLTQNAIVGVFLRVLEYYRGVMFMTTNRPDMVDDAIASRCVARIHYEVPTPERQAAIWAVQAKMNQIEFPDKEIKAVVKEYPHLSGRDVKNLMKLALLVTEANGEARITAKTIHVVKRFKSTNDLNKEPVINARS